MKTRLLLNSMYRGIGGRGTVLRLVVVFIAIGCLSTCAKIPYHYSSTKYCKTTASTVSDIIKRMQAKGTLAASFAMIEDGQIFCTGTFGWRDKEANCPVKDTTLFNFGSCAKVITTSAMMRLVDMGLVDLDEPAATYIPDFVMADERAADITVRMLLNHSPGLPGTTASGASTLEPAHDEHMAIVLDNLAHDRLKADPGAFSVYCNDGFSLAEILIARVSGKRFSEFVKDEIFTPLGMHHAQTADEPYAPDSRVAYRRALSASPYEIMNVYGSGGFSITPSDYCLLLDTLGRGGVSANGTRILSEASVAAMAEDQTTDNFWISSDAGYGLGWDAVRNAAFDEVGIVAWEKSGGTNSYTSHVIVIPEYKLGVAISCIGNDLGVADVAVLALADILKQKGVVPGLVAAPGPGDITTLPVEQRAFGGYYGEGVATVMTRFDGDGKLDVLVRQNGDWSIVNQGMSWRTNGRFAVSGTADEFYFQNVPGHGAYLMHAAPDTTGKAPIATSPVAQKLEPFAASPDAVTAWQGRTGTWLRATTLPRAADVTNPTKRVEIFDDLAGIVFVGGTPLQMYSADEARMFLYIPRNPGRDMNDAQMLDEGGSQWLRFGDVVWRPLTGVLDLPLGKATAFVTVGGKGYGEWRKSAGTETQTFSVVMTGTQPRWVAYDESFTLVGDSACGSANALMVPAGGYVQFLGAPGASFSLTTTETPAGK